MGSDRRPGGDRVHGVAAPVKVCGRNACRAVYERRPGDITRMYLTEELAQPLSHVTAELARTRRPYKIVPADELAAITESTHHEGVCFVVKPRPTPSLEEIVRRPGPCAIVLLADVSNPHNVGALVRTAAHFGARAVILAGGRDRLPPAALRTAQGGAEWVDVVPAPDAPAVDAALDLCQRSAFSLVATSGHADKGRDLFAERLPDRSVVMLGSESEGLHRRLLARADLQVRVAGTGHVESLNVAAAGAIILAELWRAQSHGRRGKGPRG